MKKKEYEKLIQDVQDIQHVIEVSDKLRYSFFWNDNGNCSSRAYKERKYSAHAEWTEGEDEYYADIGCSMSRKNVYVSREYYKNGEKTNITPIKKSLERMTARLEAETQKREKRESRKRAREKMKPE